MKGLRITQRAVERLKFLNTKAPQKQFLRVSVDPGGCHGFQYNMKLTQDYAANDLVFEEQGEKVIVDTVSYDFINGAELDYTQELIGSSFQIVNNPKADSSCGCKVSFNLKDSSA